MSTVKHSIMLADALAMHYQGLNVKAIARALELDNIQAKKLLKEALDTENEDD